MKKIVALLKRQVCHQSWLQLFTIGNQIVNSIHIYTMVRSLVQEEEVKDALDENEGGWHEYILVHDKRREFHGYNSLGQQVFMRCSYGNREMGWLNINVNLEPKKMILN